MGTFVFKWPRSAEVVYVTGTFDNWSKSVQLDKVGETFEKSVTLADANSKIYYKFVVDGDWVTDSDAPKEKDESGNDNNVLTPEFIIKSAPAAAAIVSSAAHESTTAALAKEAPLETKETAAAEPVFTTPVEAPVAAVQTPESAKILSSAAPNATTALLAAQVPLEKDIKAAEKTPEKTAEPVFTTPVEEPIAAVKTPETATILSSAAPTSTTALLAADVPLEKDIKTTTPTATMASTKEVPGAFPETPVTDLNKEVQLINPLPAAPGGVNPVHLAPGEKIPESFKTADINANVKLDPESYEKADAMVGGVTIDQLPPVTKNMIPESSLPIESPSANISSVAPTSTTAALAGAVPLEKEKAVVVETPAAAAAAPEPVVAATPETAVTSELPEIVRESQEEASFPAEASAIPEEVKEKEEVEEELLKKVPEAPVTSDGTIKETAAPAEVAAPAAAAPAPAPAAAASTPATPVSKPVAAVAAGSASSIKKKHRISGFFTKLVHKLEGNDKK